MERYVVLEKAVGETPLETLERFRASRSDLVDIPLTYAGRLDPMASGKLLVLIGEECKNQDTYRHLDKAYTVEVLLDATSDTGDILGVVKTAPPVNYEENWQPLLDALLGPITLPYPAYSSRTVHGKPLHTWAVEGRIDEVSIPEKTSLIYALEFIQTQTIARDDLFARAVQKIALLPPVTDLRKALGNDFRRPEVLASWEQFSKTGAPSDRYTILTISCICSSGTYMRTLADVIATAAGTRGLAFSIHRTDIGIYNNGAWETRFL